VIAPFRRGTTSSIGPDRRPGNVERLAGRVDAADILPLASIRRWLDEACA
jgi:hypothetical protein